MTEIDKATTANVLAALASRSPWFLTAASTPDGAACVEVIVQSLAIDWQKYAAEIAEAEAKTRRRPSILSAVGSRHVSWSQSGAAAKVAKAGRTARTAPGA